MLDDHAHTPTPGDAIQGGAAPSQDVNPSAAPSTAAPIDVNTPAVSSPADGVKTGEPPTLRQKLQEGLAKMTEKVPADGSPPEAKPQEDGQKPPETQEDPEDPLSAEEKIAPAEIMAHPAVKKILNERKQARRERNRLAREVETFKGEATQYRTIQSFLKTNGVSDSDAAEALKLAALAYTNPPEFYKKIQGMAAQWGEHLGEVLPNDLQTKVDQGLITPEDASELAAARGRERVATQRAEVLSQQVKSSDTDKEMQYRTQLFENWAGQVSRTDPDLQKKLPMISAKLREILHNEGDPATPQAAWDRLSRAHREVTEYIRQFQPARQPVTPSPASTGAPRATVKPPATYEEAKMAAIARLTSRG